MDELLSNINNLIKNHINENGNNKEIVSEEIIFKKNNKTSNELDKIILIKWIKKIFINIYPDIKFVFGLKTFENYEYNKLSIGIRSCSQYINYEFKSYYLYTNYNFILEINWNHIELTESHSSRIPMFNIQIISLDNNKKIKIESKCEDMNPTLSGDYRNYKLFLIENSNFNNIKIQCEIFKNCIETIDDEKEYRINQRKGEQKNVIYNEYQNIIKLFKKKMETLIIYKIIHPILYLDYIMNECTYLEMKKYVNKIDIIKIEELNQKLIKEQYYSNIKNEQFNEISNELEKTKKENTEYINLIDFQNNNLEKIHNDYINKSKEILEKNNLILELLKDKKENEKIKEEINNKTSRIIELENKIDELEKNIDNYKNNYINSNDKYKSLLSDVIEKDLIIKKQNIKLNEINDLYDKLQNKLLDLQQI